MFCPLFRPPTLIDALDDDEPRSAINCVTLIFLQAVRERCPAAEAYLTCHDAAAESEVTFLPVLLPFFFQMFP